MIFRDPKCVHVADSIAMANLIATWLQGQNIPAEVMNEHTLGGFEGLTGWVPGVSQRGMEVWVTHLEQAETARRLLAEHEEQLATERVTKAALTGTVAAECEECGKTTEFPAVQQGSVQECPHCLKWIDVPDPNDDWDDAEAGVPEE